MEYIEPKEFLKQSKKVQESLKNWWKPEMRDLFFRDFGNNSKNFMRGIYKGCIQDNDTLDSATRGKTFLPLLTEGQLRKYIEDKTNIKYDIVYSKGKQKFINFYNMSEDEDRPIYKIKGHDLLQAYWQVACKIAEEG